MRYGVLGATEVTDDGGRPVALGGPVQRRVLTALLVRPGSVVPVDRLVLAAWGDEAPPSAERSLQSHVTRLRDLLGRDAGGPRLTFRGGGYRLDVAEDALDAVHFARELRSARETGRSDPERAARQLEVALSLWRGQPYADIADTEYPVAEAARLEEEWLAARVDRAGYLLDAGQLALAVPELEGLVTEHRFLERAWELLVLALYRQGRQADALAAYQRARGALDDELGVEPGPALRALEAQVLAQDPALLAPARTGPVARTPCPYKGLGRYDVDDAGMFVGRERLVEELVATLVDRRLLVLVGPSGAGKSSLLRAGLLPRLAEGAVRGSEHWTTRVVMPDDAPLARLRDALADRPDLLVLDQAEAAWSDQLPPEERDAVAELLASTVQGAAGEPVRVVIALRADFYGRLTEHPVLARRAGPATVLVGPPSAEDLARIVTEPARLVGLSVEPPVVDEIVAQTSGRAGVLPLLSTALVRLWEHREGDRLTLAGYRASGGVAAALERAGEDAWAALDDDARRAAARRILVRLARLQDGRWVAYRVPRSDIAPDSDVAALAAVEVLSDRRLVVAHADSLEVAHETLFTGWPRLAGWLADAAGSRRELDRLAAAAGDWAGEGRDQAQLLRGARLLAATELAAAHPEDLAALEREYVDASAAAAGREAAAERARTAVLLRSRRRTRLLAGALGFALLVSLGAGVVAVRAARDADAAALAADAGRVGALAQDRSLGEDESLLLAAQADRMLPSSAQDSTLLSALSRSSALAAAARAPSRVLSMSASPDGDRVVTAGVGGEIVSWDARTLRQRSSSIGDSAAFVGATSDGRTVVGRQGPSPAVEVLGLDGRTQLRIEVPGNQFAPQVAVTGPWFAFVAASTDVSDMLQLRSLDSPSRVVASVPVDGHVSTLVPCGPARFCVVVVQPRLPDRLRLLDVTTHVLGLPVDTTSGLPLDPGGGPGLQELVASPDGSRIALAAGGDGVIAVRELPSGRLVRTLAVTPYEGLPRAFSPDGRLLAAYADNAIEVWDLATGDLVRSFAGHVGAVTTGAWSPDGRLLYTSGLDRQVLAWDMAGDASFARTVSLGVDGDVGSVWATPDSVVVGLSDGHLVFVHRPDGRVIRPARRAGTDYIDTVRSGGDGTLLVAADVDGTVTVWDGRTGQFLGPVDLPPAELEPQVWVADDGVTAATMRSADGPLYLIDLRTRQVRTVPLHLGLPVGLAPYGVFRWTHQGQVVLAANTDNGPITTALVVDVHTGDVVHRVPASGNPYEIDANPAGTWLAEAGLDGMLRFVRITDGHLLAPPQEAVAGQVQNLSVSPDGRYVVTGGAPGQVRLWDTTTFREVGAALPTPLDAGLAKVRFAPDGSLVAVFAAETGAPVQTGGTDLTAGGDLRHGPTVWIFPVGRTAWTALACRVVGRPLSQAEWSTYLPTETYAPACR